MSFMPGRVLETPNMGTTLTWARHVPGGEGRQMAQNKDQGHPPFLPKRIRVKGIGPGMSEVSDVLTVQAAIYH